MFNILKRWESEKASPISGLNAHDAWAQRCSKTCSQSDGDEVPGAILYLFAENVFDSDGGPGVCEPASWYRRVHPAVLRRIEAYRVYCVFRMLTGDVRHHNSIISTLGTGWATSEAEVASLDSCSWTHCDTRKPGSLRVLAGRILEQGPGPAWPHRAQERVGAPDLELL